METSPEDTTMLCQELTTMIRNRMAVVLVPALHIIEGGANGDSARILRLYVDHIGDQVACILKRYEVKRKDESSG